MSDLTIYTVAWICAIDTELQAAKQFLDEPHGNAEQLPPNDDNTYVLGKIGRHNIVIAALPHGQYGLVSAAIVARDMARSFPNLRFALMVGIGGGAPSPRHDIRLGDIVVSSPASGMGGVLQYDFGKTIQDESFQVTGYLNQSPQCLLRAIPFLEADYESDGNGIDTKIIRVLENKPLLRAKYGLPDSSTDKLFSSAYKHVGDKDQECTAVCVDASQLVVRPARPEEQHGPTIHFGLIASANQLMKDAVMRDRLSAEKDVLCFEMEAAGLMNHLPCLVIRGICDYSDTHKNKVWQGYAAMAAAAYAKDLLRKVAPNKIEAERKLVEVLDGVNENLTILSSGVKNVESRVESMQTGKHGDDITKWLGAPDVSSNLNKALQTRHPGSGQRLIQGEAYQRWKTQAKSFLWLYGIPGCGKTVLTSTAIEDLRASSDHSASLLYFYFDFTDTRKQQFENVIRSLMWQLYHKSESARKDVSTLCASCNSGRDQPRIDRMQETFAKMVQESGEVWVVLDALDECTVRDELLSWLKDVRTGKQNIHLLVSSRPERDIRSALEEFSHKDERIPITDDLIEADIRSFVHAQIREEKSFEIWNTRADIQDEMETSLVSKANGMFRWVWCQLMALRQCRDPIALRKALTSLPRTLDETYARILTNIPQEYVDHTIRILQFLTYSERPLRLAEAVDAIAVDVGADAASGSRFNPQNRMPNPSDIIGYCSSLVVLVRRADSRNNKLIIEEIQLAHFSVKDYLTSKRLASDTKRYLQATAARSLIAEVCLTYLLELKEPENIASVRDEFPFSQFSAQYWASHAVIGERSNESVLKLAQELLISRNLLRISCNLYDPDRPWYEYPNITNTAPALYYASLQGLLYCVRHLVDNKADVNAQGGRYGNALQAASNRGHREIVQLLLEKGADVNAQGGYYGSALQAASNRGDREIVQLLVDHGADVNAQGGEYGNALYAASSEGRQEIMQLLLKNKADVNAQGGEYGNALYAASERGRREIVQLLLENKADVNAQGGYYGNALQAASNRGHREIVQLLLEKGADVNAQGGYYGSALQAASNRGHREIVQLLVDHGADVNAQGGLYGNALYAASERGDREIVQLLVEKGADVNAQGGEYGSALQVASSRGDREIVQLLVDNGADVNAQGGEYGSALYADVNAQGGLYGNALYAASERGDREIVQLLVEKGADVNAQGGEYGSALYVASSRGDREIVQLLLEKGADVNAQGGDYGNALYVASSRGDREIVQLLLEKGADVNAQGGDYGNALQAASSGGHRKIVQLLLEKGADVNAQGGRYGNALQAASSGGHREIVQLLLEKGAEVNAQGGGYGNALQTASLRGHREIVQLLLEKGADVNTQGGLYGNALYAASEGGHREIVQLLLEKGADVNTQGGDYGNALQAASERGHREIVQLLLEKGADVNAQGGYLGNALQAASEGGHREIVQLLLEKGADVNAQGGGYGNALQTASLRGHREIVQLLLDKGADVNAQGGYLGNALQAASFRGHREIVQLLLDKGADVNAQGGKCGSALHAASSGEHREIVQLLNAAKRAYDDITLKRSMPTLFANDGNQKESDDEVQRQSNKRKHIEPGQESITKKPCI